MTKLIRTDANIAMMQAAQHQHAQKIEQMKGEKTIKNMAQIEEAAQEFEAVFLSEMLKPMFAEVNKADPLFGGGHGEEVFNGFMVQEYGKIMAQKGGIGIAEHVKAELIRIQEAKQETK
jgi:Rod binding domain-containing protein